MRYGQRRPILHGMTDSPASPVRAQDDKPLSLSDEVLADMLADGSYMVDACDALGLCKRTVYRRMQREPAFAEAMNAASLIGYEVKQARLERLTMGDQAAGSTGDVKRDTLIAKQMSWALEKLSPGTYGPKVEVKTATVAANYALSDDPLEAARQYAELTGQR